MADLNAYFKSIIDQDRESVVICDLNHIIIYMNPAAVVDYKKYGGQPQHRLYLSQRKARPRCLHGSPAGCKRHPDRLLREA